MWKNDNSFIYKITKEINIKIFLLIVLVLIIDFISIIYYLKQSQDDFLVQFSSFVSQHRLVNKNFVVNEYSLNENDNIIYIVNKRRLDALKKLQNGFYDLNLKFATHKAPVPFVQNVKIQKGQFRVFIRDEIAFMQKTNLSLNGVFMYFIITAVILILLILIIVFIIFVSIRQNLQTISNLTNKINKQNIKHLEEININLFAEFNPLIISINDLIIRIKNSLKMQDLFLKNAAHEMKTPLAILSLQTENLTNENLEETKRKLIKSINDEKHLVDNLLILAKLDYLQQETSLINFEEALLENLSFVSELAILKNLEVKLDLQNENVEFNKEELNIILNNLLSNAVKYNIENGYIEISFIKQILILKNSFDKEIVNKDKIFKAFVKQDTNEFGSGLGLFLVNKIVLKNNINISFHQNDDLSFEIKVDFNKN